MTPHTTTLIGGNGKTGRRIAARLRARGLSVRSLSRRGERPFDWHDPNTWERALEGSEALYLSYAPDLAVPGAAAQVRALTQLAAELKLRRLVLLAGRGEPQVHPAEDAVRASGLEYTLLECAFFAQNFTEGLLVPQQGTIAFPATQVREPFLDCDDIAEVAAKALTEAGHDGKTYELTGPELLTFGEAVQMLAEASGQPLRFHAPSFEDYATLLAPHMPPEHLHFFIDLFRMLLDGHNAHLSDDVARVLGRPARSFRDFARDAVRQGAA